MLRLNPFFVLLEFIMSTCSMRGVSFGSLVILNFAWMVSASCFGQGERDLEEVYSRMQPYRGEHEEGVDPSTLEGKVMCGYQGWFAAEGDGAGRGWFHYAAGHQVLSPGNCTFDLWPEMSELDPDEKFATSFTHRDGRAASLFSPYQRKTVSRHFGWMQDHGIDGVFLQRFGVALKSPKSLNHRNVVTANVQAGANLNGRTWATMYDLSGLKSGEITKYVVEDWKRLVTKMKITRDRSYLHHRGKPVVAVWGVGFSDGRDYTLEECEALVKFLKDDGEFGGNTVMLGVPTFWRSLNRDAVSDPKLHEIILQADIVSPWTVTRYRSPDEARAHADRCMKADIEWTRGHDLDYLPVLFPGFSVSNLKKTLGVERPINEIPRLKGEFFWSQATSFKKSGAKAFYVAMFDEIDEGTAIFKCSNDPPVGESRFLTYEGLPSDHYLWLAGKSGALLNGSIRATRNAPVRNGQGGESDPAAESTREVVPQPSSEDGIR